MAGVSHVVGLHVVGSKEWDGHTPCDHKFSVQKKCIMFDRKSSFTHLSRTSQVGAEGYRRTAVMLCLQVCAARQGSCQSLQTRRMSAGPRGLLYCQGDRKGESQGLNVLNVGQCHTLSHVFVNVKTSTQSWVYMIRRVHLLKSVSWNKAEDQFSMIISDPQAVHEQTFQC